MEPRSSWAPILFPSCILPWFKSFLVCNTSQIVAEHTWSCLYIPSQNIGLFRFVGSRHPRSRAEVWYHLPPPADAGILLERGLGFACRKVESPRFIPSYLPLKGPGRRWCEGDYKELLPINREYWAWQTSDLTWEKSSLCARIWALLHVEQILCPALLKLKSFKPELNLILAVPSDTTCSPLLYYLSSQRTDLEVSGAPGKWSRTGFLGWPASQREKDLKQHCSVTQHQINSHFHHLPASGTETREQGPISWLEPRNVWHWQSCGRWYEPPNSLLYFFSH